MILLHLHSEDYGWETTHRHSYRHPTTRRQWLGRGYGFHSYADFVHGYETPLHRLGKYTALHVNRLFRASRFISWTISAPWGTSTPTQAQTQDTDTDTHTYSYAYMDGYMDGRTDPHLQYWRHAPYCGLRVRHGRSHWPL